jgi:hypothetical protein
MLYHTSYGPDILGTHPKITGVSVPTAIENKRLPLTCSLNVSLTTHIHTVRPRTKDIRGFLNTEFWL